MLPDARGGGHFDFKITLNQEKHYSSIQVGDQYQFQLAFDKWAYMRLQLVPLNPC